MGLPIGPWLRAFEEAMFRGKSDETLIDVPGNRHSDNAVSLPLGLLKKEIRKITAGRKIAYVVD
jgi:hypothetical protein